MKILYVTTVSDTTNFFISHVNMLIDQGHSVDFACNVNRPINQSLLDRGCRVFQIDFSRSPLDLSNMRAYKEIKALIIREKFDIIHVHTPVAAALTRLAIKNIPKVKVIYTAHGFHFYKGAPLRNWLLYYPVEKYLSKHTDVLITINQEDYERAKRKFKAKQIEYVPGVGIDINKFQNITVDRERKRAELGIPKDAYVMVSVGELNENKNHSTVIKALKEVNNPNIIYIICGNGPLKDKLESLIEKSELASNVKLLGYRSDIPEILKISDLFVFPSYREGLGLAAIEAMASGLPLITSNIHGIKDYSIDGVTGYSCSPNYIKGFASAIRKIISNQEKANEFGQYNKERIIEFSDDKVLESMQEIYKNNSFRLSSAIFSKSLL